MDTVTVNVDPLKWALESLANTALENASADEALGQAFAAIQLYETLKAAGYDSAVKHVLPQLATIANVNL